MPGVFRADHVGSLLRPPEVKEGRTSFQDGKIGLDELRSIEDAAILRALHRQQAAGALVFTDGEYRRTGFQNDLIESVEGFVHAETPAVVRIWQGPGDQPTEQGTRQVVGGKLRQVRGLTDTQREFLQAHAPGPVKITIPSPSQFPALTFQPGITDRFYATRSELMWEIAAIIRAEVASLVESGVDYIQVDAPRYSYYVDPRWRQHLRELGEDPDRMFEEAVEAEMYCLEGAQGPGELSPFTSVAATTRASGTPRAVTRTSPSTSSTNCRSTAFSWNTTPTGQAPSSPSGSFLRERWRCWDWSAARNRRWNPPTTCCSESRRPAPAFRWRTWR